MLTKVDNRVKTDEDNFKDNIGPGAAKFKHVKTYRADTPWTVFGHKPDQEEVPGTLCPLGLSHGERQGLFKTDPVRSQDAPPSLVKVIGKPAYCTTIAVLLCPSCFTRLLHFSDAALGFPNVQRFFWKSNSQHSSPDNTFDYGGGE